MMQNLFNRIMCAIICFISARWFIQLGSVLFRDETFGKGDPFIIIFLPLFLIMLFSTVAIILFLGCVSLISGIYAIHPPLAKWIINYLK